jgi:hypothetical protein
MPYLQPSPVAAIWTHLELIAKSSAFLLRLNYGTTDHSDLAKSKKGMVVSHFENGNHKQNNAASSSRKSTFLNSLLEITVANRCKLAKSRI